MSPVLKKAIGAATVTCLLLGSYSHGVRVGEQIVNESKMEGIQQQPHHLPPTPLAGTGKCSTAPIHTVIESQYKPIASWFLGLGEEQKKKNIARLPEIVKAGNPVLHEPAREVRPEEIGSDRFQNIIDDMVKVMNS